MTERPFGEAWSTEIRVPVDSRELVGDLGMPSDPRALVLFAHGSGSSRQSPRNHFVARSLEERGLSTLLIDLLTAAEEAQDEQDRQLRFDIELLAGRLVTIIDWIEQQPALAKMPVGLFGASTGGGAALVAAARRPRRVAAVVSRGGRPDLAGAALPQVIAPTLLIVGERDRDVLALNREAMAKMTGEVVLDIIPGATHLFEEAGTLERVATGAGDWFERFLTHARMPHLRRA
jgi:putative phosphoribosyl transferase